MKFRIADTFTDSLGKLNGDEQKAVKTTAFDLQLNPANPGMKFHKLDRAKDSNFWSVRVSRDIRLIVHKTNKNLLLCYVDHHDAAYKWAERRKLETHPKTGAAQLVEVRETVREITIPKYVEVEQPKPKLFESVSDDDLLMYGVPDEWMEDVRQATEDTIFDLAGHLPHEAAEALLELATGGTPAVAQPAGTGVDPFAHPDAQRRFRLMTDVEELKLALDSPWEKWTVFLHPAQREIVERDYNGPARVAGSAGTGKTVVALHRAANLAKSHPEAQILCTTFSEPLAQALQWKLKLLLGDAIERVCVESISEAGRRCYIEEFGEPQIADAATIREILRSAAKMGESHRFSEQFIWTEWAEIVDAWQLDSWESYRDVPRLGRKTRLGESQRKRLWVIFEEARSELAQRDLLTPASMFSRITQSLENGAAPPFDFAVVDEAQDIGVPELRFLSALAANKANGLFFAGDLGQRIFQPPFSWKSLGVDIRGRSKTLRINYRTSHQIRLQADRLLPPELADVDGIKEERRGTISAFNGPEPVVKVFDSGEKEIKAAGDWFAQLAAQGVKPQEVGVFVRSEEQIGRAKKAVQAAGLKAIELDASIRAKEDRVGILTMHLAKGLEFRAVLVMACDDEVIPLQERIAAVIDDSDLEEVYNTERHLLYVACTRARDHLMVSGVDPASEFLDDLVQSVT